MDSTGTSSLKPTKLRDLHRTSDSIENTPDIQVHDSSIQTSIAREAASGGYHKTGGSSTPREPRNIPNITSSLDLIVEPTHGMVIDQVERVYRRDWPMNCYLNLLPYELLHPIFEEVLEYHIDTSGCWRNGHIFIEDDLEPLYLGRIYGGDYDDHLRGLGYDVDAQLPALELALVPERGLYRQFAYMRMQRCVIVLRPSVSFDWSEAFPVLSEDWGESHRSLVADGKAEEEFWDTMPNDVAWSGGLNPEEHDDRWPSMWLRGADKLRSPRRWQWEYPSLKYLSPLMRAGCRAVKLYILGRDMTDKRWSRDEIALHTGPKAFIAIDQIFKEATTYLPNQIETLTIQFDEIYGNGCRHARFKSQYSYIRQALGEFLVRCRVSEVTFTELCDFEEVFGSSYEDWRGSYWGDFIYGIGLHESWDFDETFGRGMKEEYGTAECRLVFWNERREGAN
ncbi:hypothetical protein HYFRA_00010849 [Hymenoscyphus fraxineus]|uniref:Uncharacterized protein n=1 Tax=Hymenoscyphus fraxineus TaxID=746836 RepID=A0A9N9PSX3_9HELO|nr:hypothetical protein HYFRA_00010849 [Hymenoscyphus fraxineus]